VGWSRDGGTVYYSAGKLQAISVSGGAPREIKCDVRGLTNRIRFLPDDKSLVSIRQVSEHRGETLFQLHSWPIGGGGPSVIATLPFHDDVEIGQLAVSPDGTKVLIARPNGSALLVSYPGGKVHEVPSVRDCYFLDWMPDSRHVVYTSTTGSQLVIADTESGARQVVLQGVKEPSLNAVTASSNPTRLAYGEVDLDFDILEFSIDGRYLGDLRATSAKEYQANWSPTRQVYAHFEERTGIWIRQADNSSAHVLVPYTDASNPAYSPDGRRIAFRRRGGVFAVLAAGGPITVLHNESAAAGQSRGGAVCWSPDGKWIAYTEGPQGSAQLYKMESDGRRPAVKLASSRNSFGTSCGWSADSRWIVYHTQDGVSIVPAEGGPPRLLHRGPASFAFLPSGQLALAASTSDTTVLVRVDPASGNRLASIPLAVPDGYARAIDSLTVHSDGQRISASVSRLSADIMLLEGFAQRETGWRRLFRRWKPRPLESKE
jgi:Tol biopolymer transport system component